MIAIPAAQTILQKRWLIIIAVMSATLMQVIDTTIVNVALPHMQGSLNASPDQISWTLTSYLVASAILMPLTGYFTDLFGRKKYLLICVAGFTVASAFCGASQTLSQLVIFRLLQGVFGAALVPLSQAILTDVYSNKERGKAMAIWGTGVMAGPILGPTLGGYITEFFTWRWNFYVNLPIGIFAFLLIWQVIPDSTKKNRSIDWIGLALISLAIGAFQYLLDRGNQEDWLNASSIQIATLISICSFIAFIIYSFYKNSKHKTNLIINLRIFKDRNFVISSLLLAVLGLGLYGAIVIQPLFLENLLDYPVVTTGLVMAPRGIASMLSMILVGKIINRFDPRLIIATGISITIIGIGCSTLYSQYINLWWVVWPILLQGFGIGMIFVPLSVMAFSTLPTQERVEGAGLYSLLRTLGSSIGIAITMTFFTRHTQAAWNNMAGFITPYNPAITNYLNNLHLNLTDPHTATILGVTLNQQSQIVAFVNTFSFIAWGFIVMLPLILFLKPGRQQ